MLDHRTALGRRIKTLRESHREGRWSQQTLADRSGLDRSFLAEIETDKANPTVDTLGKIADALGVSIAELFG